MADQVTGKPRTRWLKRVLGLVGFASVLGPSIVVAHSPVEQARAQLDARVLAARELLKRDETNAGAAAPAPADKVAQWMNWPNWGNWGNWPNWNNWGNWNNWWNR